MGSYVPDYINIVNLITIAVDNNNCVHVQRIPHLQIWSIDGVTA